MSPRNLYAALACVVVLLFATALFYPAICGGKILAPLDITSTLLAPWNEYANGLKPHNHNPTDAVTQYLPYRMFAEMSFAQDGYIGWNPYEMGGYNLAANTMALPGTWTMQLHRLFPFGYAWNLGIITEFLIAGFGMLVFLRSRGLPWLPCLIGTVAFMANSQFIVWIYHRWALSSFCWMPWILWAAVGLTSFRELRLRNYILPLFLAMAMMGASLQHVVFILLGCMCLFLGQVRDFRRFLGETQRIALWASAFLLATAIASFTLIPQIQSYFTNISIGNTRGGIGYAQGETQPILNLFAIIAQIWPWLVGDPQTIDGWRLLKSGYFNMAYMGTIPMMLGICGVFHRSMPAAAKWLVVLGLVIPLSPLVGPLYHRVQLLFLLGGSWMAAEMLAYFVSHPSRRWHKFAIASVISLGILLLGGSLLPSSMRKVVEDKVVEKSLVAGADSQFGVYTDWIERRARSWTDRFALHYPRTAWVYGLLVIGTAGLVVATGGRRARVGQGVILVVASMELVTLFQTWTTYSSPENLQLTHPLLGNVREFSCSDRVLQGAGSIPTARIFAPPNMLAAAGFSVIDAYESIQYPGAFYALADLPVESQLSLAGVGVSVQSVDIEPLRGTHDWPIVKTCHGFDIRRNPHVIPKILTGKGAQPTQAGDLIEFLKTGVAVTPTLETMNRLTLRLPVGASWLRISQNWHQGWRWRDSAYSAWQPFQRGLDNACWIQSLSPGTTQISVRFFPRSPVLEGVSMLAAFVATFLLVVSLIRHSHHKRIESKN